LHVDLGREQAGRHALEIGEQVGSPLSENIGYVCMGMAHLVRGDPRAALESAREGIAFSRRAKSYCFGLVCELSLSRALRADDAVAHESEILEGLARCDELLGLSDATGLAPVIAEERARMSAAPGTPEATAALRAVQQQYAEVGSTGQAARIAAELPS